MDNNKMTRVAKNLDIFANVGGKITASAGIVCILIAFLTIVFGSKMFVDGNVTLNLDFIKFHLKDNAYVNEQFIKWYVFAATLGGAIICFLVYYVSSVFRKILAPMKNGRPFEVGISENLKKVGLGVLVGGFLSELVGVVARILLIKAYSIDELLASSAIDKTEFAFTMNLDFLLIACVILLLSYIFTYGQALQQEADETL